MLKTTIVLAAGVLLAGFGVVLPALLSIRSINASIGDAQILLERQYQQRQALRETAANLQSIRGTSASLSDYAIREGKELDFIQALEGIATHQHVTQDIQLITAQQQKVSDWEQAIPITIVLQGKFTDILRYLRSMEALPYLVQLDTFKVQEVSAGGVRSTLHEPTGAIEARISGKVNWIAAKAPDFLSKQ